MTGPTQIPLGYLYAPPRREHEPGYPTVELWIAKIPTLDHFDPEQVRLDIFSEGHIDNLEIEHPWSGDSVSKLAVGTMIIIDRKNKHLDGFLFGGEMEIEVTESFTHICLTSPAPIMLRSHDRPEINLLIEEACILLARRRAAWAEQPDELEKRLSRVEPLDLYAAFLKSIDANFEQLPPSDDENLIKAQHILHQELEELSHILPGFELPAEDLC